MKNYYLIYFLCLIFLQQSCSKDRFDYRQVAISKERIDTLIFNTSHYVLNADGKSALYYKLAPSYYVTEERTYTAAIALSWFDRKDYGFFYEEPDGRVVEIEKDYLTFPPDTPAKKIQVFARMFGQETRRIEVEVRKPLGNEVKEKIIPVVFHIFQYTGTTNTEFVIEAVHLNDRIRKLNNAFSRLVSSGASATDTKIRFELAATTDQGRPMAVPGMNKIKFGAEKLNPTDFKDFYDEEQHFKWSAFFTYYGAAWDPAKFLNIWVLPTGNEKIPDYTPDLIGRGAAPLKGLTLEEVDEEYLPEIIKCGIIMNYSAFLNTELNAALGKFLGLLPTSDAEGVVDGDSDYCSDTFLYSKTESQQEAKNGINKPITFISDNIMDQTTQNITVTKEQAERMHYVLENVPSRKMWKGMKD